MNWTFNGHYHIAVPSAGMGHVLTVKQSGQAFRWFWLTAGIVNASGYSATLETAKAACEKSMEGYL